MIDQILRNCIGNDPIIPIVAVGSGFCLVTGIALQALGFGATTHIQTATFLVFGALGLGLVATATAINICLQLTFFRGQRNW